MLFTCYICGEEAQSAQRYEDLVGNKIYVCCKCGKRREHRVEYRFRRIPALKYKIKGKVQR